MARKLVGAHRLIGPARPDADGAAFVRVLGPAASVAVETPFETIEPTLPHPKRWRRPHERGPRFVTDQYSRPWAESVLIGFLTEVGFDANWLSLCATPSIGGPPATVLGQSASNRIHGVIDGRGLTPPRRGRVSVQASSTAPSAELFDLLGATL